jgi:hypothetical protein
MNIELITKEEFLILMNKIEELSQKIEELRVHKLKEFIIPNEMAPQILNMSGRVLNDLRKNKEISYSQYGKKIWYTADDILNFLDNNKIVKR